MCVQNAEPNHLFCRSSDMLYQCKLCDVDGGRDRFETASFPEITDHTFREHRRVTASFGKLVCCLPGCSFSKTSFSQWKTHVLKCSERRVKQKPEMIERSCLYDCPNCAEQFVTEQSLLSHLRVHLTNGSFIVCPYDGCMERICSLRTFRRHRRNKHSNCILPGRIVINVRDGDAPESVLEVGDCDEVDVQEEELFGGELVADSSPGEQAPSWFVDANNGNTVLQEIISLCVAANVLFKVPKSKVRPFFELVDSFTSRWMNNDGASGIADMLEPYCGADVASQLETKIVERLASNLPLRRAYDRSSGSGSGGVTTDYRLTAQLKSFMQYVPPVDIAREIKEWDDADSCPLDDGAGQL